jgi:hypothetical protein
MPAREHAGPQIIAEESPSRLGEPEAGTGSRLGRIRPAPSPMLIGVIVCLALGIVSVLTLPSLPGYDAFAWVVWGREAAHQVLDPSQPFVVGGGPSWKPFPVLFTTAFGLFGGGPKVWVAFARAAGLFGLFVAYRLGDRLAASPRWRLAGPIAGVLAAFGLILTSQWTHYWFRGTSEPLVITTTLLAIERHLAGRRIAAFVSGVALVLMRPEAALFLGLYAGWLFFADRRLRARLVLVVGILAIGAGWLVPPWIASGQPLLASIHARAFNGQLGQHPFLEVLKRATNLSVWPVIIAALAVTLLAIRTRDWLIVTLAAAGLAYVAVVEAMTLDHYPGLERFMLPAAAVACVLAGVAVARFATFAGGGAASLAVAVVLVAIAVPFFAGRLDAASTEKHTADQAVDIYRQLVAAVHKAGGAGRIFPCQKSYAAVNHTMQTGLAWALSAPLTQVHTVTYINRSLRRPALAFFAPRNPINGGAPTAVVGGLRGHLIARAGIWKVFRVTKAGARRANACVGT